MFRWLFFVELGDGEGSLVDRVSSMMGALFYRKVALEEIRKLEYKEMSYWFKWHGVFEKEEVKRMQNLMNAAGL